MSDLPPRPPLPPSQDNDPGEQPEQQQPKQQQPKKPAQQKPTSKPKEKKEDKKEDKKEGKKRGKQLGPIVVMTILLVVVGFIYMGVRGARLALAPPAPKTIQLSNKVGDLSLEITEGWKGKKMGAVKGSSARWAFGPAGATDYALFLTRYPLSSLPESEQQLNKVQAKAQRSLAQTGGPADPKAAGEEKVGGQTAWRYAFRKNNMWIDIWLVIHSHKGKAALYQFSCQSKPKSQGDQMRQSCAESIDSVKFSDKAA